MTQSRGATHLLYRAEHGDWPPTGDAACWLCGAPCPADGPRSADVVRSTFNDMARARRGGDSEVACAACAWYFDHKILRPGGARAMGFFTKTVIVLGTRWFEWEREQMAADLLAWHRDGVPDVAVLAINYSKQKHVLPWARVTPAGARRPWIESDIGRCRLPDAYPDAIRAVAALWQRGHPKSLLGAGQLAAQVLARSADPAGDLTRIRTLAPFVGTPTMELLTYSVTEANRDHLAA